MKDLTIKIIGHAGSGKTILQYILFKELKKLGMSVEYIHDEDFKTIDDLERYCDKFFKENGNLNHFNVKIETVQTKIPIKGYSSALDMDWSENLNMK